MRGEVGTAGCRRGPAALEATADGPPPRAQAPPRPVRPRRYLLRTLQMAAALVFLGA